MRVPFPAAALASLLLAGCLGGARPVPRLAPEPAAARPAAPAVAASSAPVYLSLLPNVNDYAYFSDGGGWDGNAHVGYDTCWVVKLPPAPPGAYERAFLGAKLGRAKREPIPGRPAWEKRPIRGEIDIAVSDGPQWPLSQRFFLTRAQDLPLEAEPDSAVDGAGEGRWIWTEIPLAHISFTKPHYLALFSPSSSLSGRARSPILAAGPSDGKKNAWLATGVKGRPPFQPKDALRTPVHYLPALAVKLVPAPPGPLRVALAGEPRRSGDAYLLSAQVAGEDVSFAWVEASTDTVHWRPVTASLRGAPYQFTVKPGRLPQGVNHVRVVAEDAWGQRGASDAVDLSGAAAPADE